MNDSRTADRHPRRGSAPGAPSEKKAVQAPPGRKVIFLSIAGLAVITLAAFWPVFTAGYIIWDDESFIVGNETIQELTLDNVKKMFMVYNEEGIYIPLAYLSYAVEIALFGKDPTAVFHTVNVLFHLGNTILVLVLIYKLTKSFPVSLITAALFAVHPMHVESVAWIMGRKDVLSTFFMLAAFIFYLTYLADNRGVYYVLSLAGFIIAAMAKPMVIMVPVLLILFDYFTGQRPLSKKRLFEKIPFFCVSILIAAVTIYLHLRQKAISRQLAFNVGTNIVVAADNVVFYLRMLIAPVKISLFYPLPDPSRVVSLPYLLSIFIFVVISAGAIISLRWTKKIIFGYLFFLAAILPVIGFVPAGAQSVADRYTYVPYVGLFLIIGHGAVYLMNRAGPRYVRPAVICVLVLIVLGATLTSFVRSRLWRSSEKLLKDAISKYQKVPTAHSLLGTYYLNAYFDRREETGEAEKRKLLGYAGKHLKIALAFRPNDEDYISLGNVYLHQKDYKNAAQILQKALELNPEHAVAHFDLGNVYLYVGMYERAVKEFESAVRLNPNKYEAYENIGIIYLRQDQPDRALEYFQKSLDVSGGDPFTYVNISQAYIKKGLYKEALEELDKALKLGPRPSLRKRIEKDRERLLDIIKRSN